LSYVSPTAVTAVSLLAAASVCRAEDAPAIEDYADQFYTTDVGANRVPRLGTTHVLVVPVSFGDASAYRREFMDFLYPAPVDRFTFSEYWRLQSAGRFHPIPDLMDVMEFGGCPVDGLDGCVFEVENVGAALELFRLIFDRILASPDHPLAAYDESGPDGEPDGWTDGIIVIIPTWRGGVAPPVYPFMEVEQDGVQVGAIAIGRPDETLLLHEFGHNLGAADQYLWGFRHSLMSTCDDCSLDAHSRVGLEWADVVEVGAGQEVTLRLPPTLVEPAVVRIGAPPEYFLLEHRAPFELGGWTGDRELGGLVLVHVDEALRKPFLAQTDTPEWHPLLKVEEPSNRSTATVFEPGDVFLPAKDGDHGPTTADAYFHDSSWYDGTYSGVRVRCVRELPDGVDGALAVTIRGPTPYASETAGDEADCPPLPAPDAPDAGSSDEPASGGGGTGDSGCGTAGGVPGVWVRSLRR